MQNEKCVMVLDERLPLGIAANTAAILGITLGQRRQSVVGADVYDQAGRLHAGIITIPVPVLRGTPEELRMLRRRLYEPDFSDLTVVDFSELAQGCGTYEEFTGKMAEAAELDYLGIAICGGKKKINRLTGSMALLR